MHLKRKVPSGSAYTLSTAASVPTEQEALILALEEFDAAHAGLASGYAIALVAQMRGQEALPGAADAVNGATSAFPQVGNRLVVLGWPIEGNSDGEEERKAKMPTGRRMARREEGGLTLFGVCC